MSNVIKYIKLNPNDTSLVVHNPFIFGAHHVDNYPAGNDDLAVPPALLESRKWRLGDDFINQKGYRMYHGHSVPGFPAHPHRGFETVTFALEGIVDHFDGMGQKGRYGNGDVQWMTAGRGMQHSEMIPLLNKTSGNNMNWFQIWLNLKAKNKLVDPAYKMLWNEQIPHYIGEGNDIRVVAGTYKGVTALSPTPDSYANDPTSRVRMLLIDLAAGAEFVLEGVSSTLTRIIFMYEGESAVIEDQKLANPSEVFLAGDADLVLKNGDQPAKFLLLEGEPIDEPIASYGPFVMNTKAEIYKAIDDFQADQFGGWPHPSNDHVNGPEETRFALFADGRVERP